MSDDEIDASDEPFDADSPESIDTFWKDAVVTRDGAEAAADAVSAGKGCGPQKTPKKVLLSVRYSPEVVEYFKSIGKGWQTRMDEVLKAYVDSHR